MGKNKHLRWLLAGLGLLLSGIIIVAILPETWFARPTTTDVCGNAIVPVPMATQRAMQTTMYSMDILRQAFAEGRISRDQFYLYQIYLVDYREKYPDALRGNHRDPWNPRERGFERDTFLDTREKFCTFSPCMQQELNSIRFRSKLHCQQGQVVTITPLLEGTPTP
ncbi:hypothetical protein [Herpetosiphon geysericola]|uniref:Uncharacterized protein n=1 Tax=Herpetosiphon geysericola TaxID=70996 RepID=A0A0P6Z027_9CHLR|nr:hypothetical protein [Herpetosiphon geysericola]KPL90115.1 hypothetical protein SE18_07830 [Herpetosiphon geysericola]